MSYLSLATSTDHSSGFIFICFALIPSKPADTNIHKLYTLRPTTYTYVAKFEHTSPCSTFSDGTESPYAIN
jgi:hypothetical protein